MALSKIPKAQLEIAEGEIKTIPCKTENLNVSRGQFLRRFDVFVVSFFLLQSSELVFSYSAKKGECVGWLPNRAFQLDVDVRVIRKTDGGSWPPVDARFNAAAEQLGAKEAEWYTVPSEGKPNAYLAPTMSLGDVIFEDWGVK